MSDGIIDIGEYLRRRDGDEEPTSTFSLWGADGERSRFALPLWRAIYLTQGERGGVLWSPQGTGELNPFVVLDLASEPARTEFPLDGAVGPSSERVPELRLLAGEGISVYLGEERERQWFLVVAGGGAGSAEPTGRDREDVLFLAGECAGLLFLRDFAEDAGS